MSSSQPEVALCPHCRSVFRGAYQRCPRDGTALEVGLQDGLPGTTLGGGRYVVRRRLGEGGAGVVYEAGDRRLPRRYAIKVLFGDLAVLPDMLQRFRREAEAAGRLDHPNVAAVVDYQLDVEGEPPFLVMELVEGETLAARLMRTGPMRPEEARKLLRGVCEGLVHAHARGVIHRDLKPDNVILEQPGDRPRIVDFGVSRVEGGITQSKLTQHGVLVGTPGFMAPELLMGKAADARSDLFALGVTAYATLAACLPFSGSEEDAVEATLAGLDPTLGPMVPPDLAQLVADLMAPDREARPRDAAEVLARLEAGARSAMAPLQPETARALNASWAAPTWTGASSEPRTTPVAAGTPEPDVEAPSEPARGVAGRVAAGAVLLTLGLGFGIWVGRPGAPADETATLPAPGATRARRRSLTLRSARRTLQVSLRLAQPRPPPASRPGAAPVPSAPSSRATRGPAATMGVPAPTRAAPTKRAVAPSGPELRPAPPPPGPARRPRA
ncbi:MAG: protein kinase [Deltaproteobacteria bacterium]|nr:protein kinase [Deltaproteobacteria bacterium]